MLNVCISFLPIDLLISMMDPKRAISLFLCPIIISVIMRERQYDSIFLLKIRKTISKEIAVLPIMFFILSETEIVIL